MALTTGLSACGHGGSGLASGNATASAASSAAGVASSPLRITSWGPQSTKADTAFDVQPDGSAALWIRVNRSLEGDEAAVDFNGMLLAGNISGNVVTAGVPASLYATPGVYAVHVIARKGNDSVKSNGVIFTVQ